MALSIKNAETEQLARQIAKETGETLTEAIQKSLRERLERLEKEQRRHEVVKAKLEEIVRRVHAMPILDTRSEDEILGYDENGIPR
jgi:antitoxin VapB